MPLSLPAFLAGTLETLQLTTVEPDFMGRERPSLRLRAAPFDVSPGAGPIDEGGPLGGFASKSNRLDMQMEIQQHTQWCWAAVSVSVAAFLDQSSNWTQCSLATRVKQVDCCDGYTDDCDLGEVLSKPLKVVGVYSGFQSAALPYPEVKQTIEQSLPVCCFIDWNDGSGIGHFVVIGGWLEGDSGTVYLDVFDPSDGAVRQVVYSKLVEHGYRAGGSWTDSYLVKKPVPTV